MDQAVQTLLATIITPVALGLFIHFRTTRRQDRDKLDAQAKADAKHVHDINDLIAGLRHLVKILADRYADCSLTYDKTTITPETHAKRRNDVLSAAISDTALDLGYGKDWFMV